MKDHKNLPFMIVYFLSASLTWSYFLQPDRYSKTLRILKILVIFPELKFKFWYFHSMPDWPKPSCKVKNGNEGRRFRSFSCGMCSCDALECVTFHPFWVLCFQLFWLRWFWFREILEVLFEFQNDSRRGIQYFNSHIFHEYWLNGVNIWIEMNEIDSYLANWSPFGTISAVKSGLNVKSMMMSILVYNN